MEKQTPSNLSVTTVSKASHVALVVMNLPANAGDVRLGFNSWAGKIPWSRKWHPTPVFFPGESHGQRSLAGSCL